MGTRGAIGFFKNGVEKVTYNHFDSYPDGLGQDVLDELANVTIEKLNEAFDRIELVSGDQKPTQEQINACSDLADTCVSSGKLEEWYVLLRKAQGCIGVYWAKNPLSYMIDGKNFLKDSLFCEYAYIINLDTEQLEFYRGFNQNPEAAGRYASLTRNAQSNEYYGVKLELEIPLSDINKNSIASIVKKMQIASGYNVDEDETDEDKTPETMGKVNAHDVEAFLSAKENMIQMELDLPNDLIATMHKLADDWTKSFGREIDASDALSILLTKITNDDFEEIVKKYK